MRQKKKKKTVKKAPKRKKQKHALQELPQEFPGWMTLSLATIIFFSLLSFAYTRGAKNWLGLTGDAIGWIFTAVFGLSGYFVALYVGWVGWRRFFMKPINSPLVKHCSFGLFILSTCLLLTLFESVFPETSERLIRFFYTQQWEEKRLFHLGGAPAYYLYKDLPVFNLNRMINSVGVFLVFFSTWVTSLLLFSKISPARALEKIYQLLKSSFCKTAQDNSENSLFRYVKLRTSGSGNRSLEPQISDSEFLAIKPERNLLFRPSFSKKEIKDSVESDPFQGVLGKQDRQEEPILTKQSKKRAKAFEKQKTLSGNYAEYKLPLQSLLTTPKRVDQTRLKKDLRKQAEVLEETLQSFGIEAKVGQINCGPAITSFEVHPAIGVKVQKIKALENDIALNMEAKSIRILAPIPGKAAIGIEVPNPYPQEVGFKDMLQAYLQSNKKYHIPVLLGKKVNGEYVMEDLVKMPHVIIAGATGSGKSVCINTIVMSILMTAKPDEIKLLMIDPKKVELTPYTKLPHMLAKVITEPAGACAAMSFLVKEMENRYEILKLSGFRNIAAFNSRSINKDFEESLDHEIPEKMHYIVCIIDELADLMMVSSNDIETYIARIAQMARAVGIHMILATQRPSREVITGLIKANFPTRISFKVSSRINSQIILDEIGAESLLGNGDLLFLPPGSHHLVRAQGAYIRDQDSNRCIRFICNQAPPNYVIESFDEMDQSDFTKNSKENAKDSLYQQAVETVLQHKKASTTFLQRKLKIGYPTAASLIDQLENEGIIGPAEGSKPREILLKNDVD